MSERLEAVDAQGHLHTVAHASSLDGTKGYVCTCGAWRSRGEFWQHLEEVGTPTVAPPPPTTIDTETRALAEHAAVVESARHMPASWSRPAGEWTVPVTVTVRCGCDLILDSWRAWADHLAHAVVKAALDELSTR